MFMRLAAALAGLAVLAASGTAAASVPHKPRPPVKLPGAVTNRGVGVVEGGKVAVEADDFSFDKTFIKARAGRTVRVIVRNAGTTTHTFTIDNQHIDKTIQPGQSVKVSVKIPAKPKFVNFYCRFHVGSGMQGAFFSKASATPTSKATSRSPG
jgi:plastocyanin